MEKDLVSIILPVYNAEQTLANSIASVLEQTYRNYELLIINDGSTDNTENVINQYNDSRITYIKNEKNIGLIKTLNKGISLSKGEYIARIDSDDMWIDKEKLSKQVIFLRAHTDHVLVGTQALIIDRDRTIKTNYPTSDKEIRKKILSKNTFIHSSVMFRKELLSDTPYQIEDYLMEDYSLWLQLGLTGKFANLPDYSLKYFFNPNGETQKNNIKQCFNSLSLIKKYKHKYPRYYIGVFMWYLKIYSRKILINLKHFL